MSNKFLKKRHGELANWALGDDARRNHELSVCVCLTTVEDF